MVKSPKDIFEGANQVEVKHDDGRIFGTDRKLVKASGISQGGNFAV